MNNVTSFINNLKSPEKLKKLQDILKNRMDVVSSGSEKSESGSELLNSEHSDDDNNFFLADENIPSLDKDANKPPVVISEVSSQCNNDDHPYYEHYVEDFLPTGVSEELFF